MSIRLSRSGAGMLAVLVAATALSCGRARGASSDPLAREAEDALVSYLRIDTSNPPGNETLGASFLHDQLEAAGIPSRLIGEDQQRQGIYARLEAKPKAREKALILFSHIDVVPARAAQWTQPPFGGIRSSGYIWGRGALDSKSLTIAHLYALIDLKRRGAKLRRDVIFIAVPDEELGGERGAKRFLEKYPELFRDAGFAMNEGGANETAVDRVLSWGIEVQQKVPLWVRLTAEGAGGHGAGPPDDGGAPAKLIRALAAIQTIDRPYRLTPTVARVVAIMATRGGPRAEVLRVVREPLDVPRIERDVPMRIRNLLRDTITITRLEAGTSVNVLPPRASAEIDIRLLPGSDTAPMLARVREAAGKNATVEVIHAGQPSPESPASGDLYDTISTEMRAAEAGSSVVPLVSAGATDSRYLRAKGITTYGVLPFKVNYYDADSIHSDDERIRTPFFDEGVVLMRNIVRRFCEAR